MTHTYLYARVSTADQCTDIQAEQLQKAYPQGKLKLEKASATTLNRPELQKLLEFMDKGDKLVVLRIDRLARNMADLLSIVQHLENKGASLEVLDQKIDTGSPSGKAFLQMLGVFAEFETNLRKERQAAGIAKAKAEGKFKGGQKTVDREAVQQMLDEGVNKMQIAKKLGIGRATVYRIIEELREA
jgi:DNA invertase Pin-like site-specific DNA recombinase